jgi:hypothetical protein
MFINTHACLVVVVVVVVVVVESALEHTLKHSGCLCFVSFSYELMLSLRISCIHALAPFLIDPLLLSSKSVNRTKLIFHQTQEYIFILNLL